MVDTLATPKVAEYPTSCRQMDNHAAPTNTRPPSSADKPAPTSNRNNLSSSWPANFQLSRDDQFLLWEKNLSVQSYPIFAKLRSEKFVLISVPDPEPLDPHFFGLPRPDPSIVKQK